MGTVAMLPQRRGWMDKDLFLVVKVTLPEDSELNGPDITDRLQDMIDVGFDGSRIEDLGGDIKRIKVMTGFCEE